MKLLDIGNSFANNALHYLPQIFANAGLELTIGKANIGGCSLELHWYNAEHDIARYGLEYEGPNTLREMLTSDCWDVVTLQQASHFSWQCGTYEPYMEKLIAYVHTYAPSAKIVLHETWAYCADNPRLTEQYKITMKQMQALIRENYQMASAKYQLDVFPVGDAFEILQELTDDPFGHLTRCYLNDECSHACMLGEYMGGLVWYGVLTGRDPAQITFIPEALQQQDEIVGKARTAVKKAIAAWKS